MTGQSIKTSATYATNTPQHLLSCTGITNPVIKKIDIRYLSMLLGILVRALCIMYSHFNAELPYRHCQTSLPLGYQYFAYL